MTHINAYFEEVNEKRQAVQRAEGELADAEARLEVKKREDGFVEPKVEKSTEEPKPEESKEDKPSTHSNFLKKKK